MIWHPLLTYRSLERFLKRLVGRSDIEDALRSLDNLTREESRMVAAQGLRATHGVGEGVMSIGNDVQDTGLDSTHLALFQLPTSSYLWLAGENMRGELQQVARDISDLAKDADDDTRS